MTRCVCVGALTPLRLFLEAGIPSDEDGRIELAGKVGVGRGESIESSSNENFGRGSGALRDCALEVRRTLENILANNPTLLLGVADLKQSYEISA